MSWGGGDALAVITVQQLWKPAQGPVINEPSQARHGCYLTR